MQYQFKDGRRPIGGTSSGVRSNGRRVASQRQSLQRACDHRWLNLALVGMGTLVYATALFSTGVLFEYATAFTGCGFIIGLGAGAALIERSDRR